MFPRVLRPKGLGKTRYLLYSVRELTSSLEDGALREWGFVFGIMRREGSDGGLDTYMDAIYVTNL